MNYICTTTQHTLSHSKQGNVPIQEMDVVIDILDDSSSDGEQQGVKVVRASNDTPTKQKSQKTHSKARQDEEVHSDSIEILGSGSVPSSPTRHIHASNIEKPTQVVDESAELHISFVDDDEVEISNEVPIVTSKAPLIETVPANSKRNLKRVRSLLDDIRDEFGYSSSSDEEVDFDILLGKKKTTHRPISGSKQITGRSVQGISAVVPQTNGPQKSTSKDVIVIDGTMSSSQAHNTYASGESKQNIDVLRDFPMSSSQPPNAVTSEDSAHNIDVLKDFPMSSQKSVPCDNEDDLDIVHSASSLHNVAQSSQNTKLKPPQKPAKVSKTIKPTRLSAKKRKSNVRLLRRGDTDGMDGVDLEISMLLDDHIEDSSFDLSQSNAGERSASQPSVPKVNAPVPMVQRSKTTDFVDKFEEQRQTGPRETQNRFMERLSQYIINGHTYTDEESQTMVQQCIRNEKAKFKLVNQIYRDNVKARECIIIDLPKSLLENFNKTDIRVDELVSPATIQQSYSVDLPLIRFFRHCDSIYDFKHDYYYPCEKKIIEENVLLAYYDARDFFEQYTNHKVQLYKNLRMYWKTGKQLIIVLNEVGKFKRSIEQVADRLYKAKVNEQLGKPSSPSKRSSNLDEVEKLRMSASKLEERIMFINREWGMQILTVNSNLEFIHSLPNIASLISKKRMDPALRYMQYAYINVKSGKDQSDVLRKVLHDVGKIPDLKAGSIVRTYPKFMSLFNDFQEGKLKSDQNGNHIMTPMMERRLFKFFTSTNPDDVLP